MINDKMLKAFNDQITREIYSAYIYLQMAAWFEEKSLEGFAQWMKVQSQEEMAHAMVFWNHVYERGGQVELGALEKPPVAFASPQEVFEKALEHEKYISDSINKILDLAIESSDHASKPVLNWFVEEQIEEEDAPTRIIEKLKMIGDGNGLFMLDKEMGVRTFNMPAPLAKGEA